MTAKRRTSTARGGIVLAMAALAWLHCGADAPTPYDGVFDGLDSRGLTEKIRELCRPSGDAAAPGDIRSVIASYSLTDGGYSDYFGVHPAASPDQLEAVAAVYKSWWGNDAPADLHNIIPANGTAAQQRGDYPPGEVTEAVFDNGALKIGTGYISGMEAGFYEIADELKGDLARIYMYMACVYPSALWHGRGAMLYADGLYPLLTPYGRDVLLRWHRADPVDGRELDRDAAIAASGHCRNPFVTLPQLAEYIWGSHCDEAYTPGTPAPGDDDEGDDNEDAAVPLKSRYSLSADKWLWLKSPYVGKSSSWTVDGQPAAGRVAVAALGPGIHELTYTCEGSHGKILITVDP